MPRPTAHTPTPAKGSTLPVTERALTIPGRDGYPLAGTSFDSAMPPKGTVVVGPAPGVRARFYAPLAKHLAGQGFRAVTFDYRGIGPSAPPQLRGFHATLRTWAELDLAGVIAHAMEADQGPVFVLGHGISGQL